MVCIPELIDHGTRNQEVQHSQTALLCPGRNPVACPSLVAQEELEAAGLSTIVDRSKAAEDIRKLAEADERLPEAVVKAFDDAMRSSGRSVQSVFDALALPESADKGAS